MLRNTGADDLVHPSEDDDFIDVNVNSSTINNMHTSVDIITLLLLLMLWLFITLLSMSSKILLLRNHIA